MQATELAKKNGTKDQSGAPIGASVLMGKFKGETGDWLTPTHTQRHGRRLRYYVSNRLFSGGTDPKGSRLSASNFEKAVAKVIADHLTSLAGCHKLLNTVSVVESETTSKAGVELAHALQSTNQKLL